MSHDRQQTAMREGASFVRNTACPHFPCHRGIDERAFNCLFCYCPLYTLGERCGGDFTYTATGIKDCSRCTRMHEGDAGADMVRKLFPLLAALARADDGAKQ